LTVSPIGPHLDPLEERPMTERGATLEEPAGAWRNVFRRRRFVVDGGYQYRAAFLAVAVALLLLIILNLSLVFTTREGVATAPVAPELRAIMAAQDRVQIGLVATGSLVFLVGVFLVSILETHRTAGAAFKISRSLDRVREGRLDTRLRLRRGDNLQEVAASVNAMTGALQERAWQEVEWLESVAERLEQSGADPAATEAARELRAHAANRRALLG
jgi:methyl-accepting chemotaxis protein